MGITRNNHYIPQMYLNAWKNEKGQVYVYNLLVPNANMPFWESKSTKSVTSELNLYTSLDINNNEVDSLEKLFNEKYETPAKIPLEKAINGESLSIDELNKLIEFLACSIVRTPYFLIKILGNTKDYQSIFEEQIDEISKELRTMNKDDFQINNVEKKQECGYESFPIKFTNTGTSDEKGNLIVKVETIIGKQFYFSTIKNLLNNTAKILHKHKWNIIEVDKNVMLPTSDNPVICLNYNSEDDYNFEGAWGMKNSNILFPISPNKILYTQVGINSISKIKVDYNFSVFLKKIIIEHSHRTIISKTKDEEILKTKKRHVSLEAYNIERKNWSNLHKNYLEIESEYINNRKNE